MTEKQHINNLSALQFNEACSPLLDTLCEPLFKNFGITHFGYIRIFEDGKVFRIANNKAWTRTYFQNEFYNCLESDIEICGLNHVPLNEQRFMILNGPPQNDHLKILYSEFNIWNFLLIHEKSTTYIDFWFFGADCNNTQIINFYINNKYVFQHFIVYVKNKSCQLFDMNDSSKFISTNTSFLKESLKEENNLQKFIKELSHNKFYLSGQHNEKFLSKRESECLFYFSRGNTMKEIAERIDLSPRTIETYLNSIRDKVQCRTKSELISMFSNIYSSYS